MRAATKRAPEGPAGDQEQRDPGHLVARQKYEHAASIQVCDSVDEQRELLRQEPPRALPAPGRGRSEEKQEIRSKERSPRPLAKSLGRMGDYPIAPRKLFAEGMPSLRPEFAHLAEFPSAGVLPDQGSFHAPSAAMPIVRQLSWLSGGQASEPT